MANPSSRLKSILKGMQCVSKDWKTISEEGDAFKSTNDVATLQEVGNRFCGTYSATRKDERKVYYRRDRVFNLLGKGTTYEGFHRCDHCKIPF